jgi:hypothetical protein
MTITNRRSLISQLASAKKAAKRLGTIADRKTRLAEKGALTKLEALKARQSWARANKRAHELDWTLRGAW